MATIRKRKNVWCCEIRIKGFPSQYKTFDTKADADAWASEIETKMRRRKWFDTSEAERTSIAEALDRYRTEITPFKKGARSERYRVNTIKRDRISQFALANVRSTDVAAYRDRRLRLVAPNTVNNELILLSHLFTIAAKEWGMESLTNPVANVRRPKLPRGRERRITEKEEHQLLAACDSVDMKVAITLALETGMRRGELGDLLWRDLDGRVLHITDSKNGEDRYVPLSSRAMQALQRLPRRIDGRIFSIKSSTMGQKFMALKKKVDLYDIHFHDLRHEATSRLFERGLSIEEVSKITGHKTWAMLQRYTHLRASSLVEKLG